MTATTPVYGFTYPLTTDPPLVPTHVQTLAQNVETVLQAQLAYLLSPPYFHGYASAAQSGFASGTPAAVNLDAEIVDTISGHSTVAGSQTKYQPNVAGTYEFRASTYWPGTFALNGRFLAEVRKNGVAITGSKYGAAGAEGSEGFVSNVATTFGTTTLNGTTDYLELWGSQNATASTSTDPGSLLVVRRVSA